MKLNLPNQRQMKRALDPSGRRVREPIPPKLRRELVKRAKGKCQYARCNIKEGGSIKLEVHHKNQKNDDNRPSNLMILCATHHRAIHKENPKKRIKDPSGLSVRYRVTKKKVKKATKKAVKKTAKKKVKKAKKKKTSKRTTKPFNFGGGWGI